MSPPNADLLYQLLRYYVRKNAINQGFVLPSLIGLGLIMTIVGLTLIVRSSDSQQSALLQQDTNKSENLTEVGITRTQELFLRVPSLAKIDYSNWENYANTFIEPIELACGGELTGLSQEIKDFTKGWIDLGNKGYFRIINYDGDTGNLKIEGTTETVKANIGSSSQAMSSISVIVPFDEAAAKTLNIGLWVEKFNDGTNKSLAETNQKVDSNVLSQSCEVTGSDFDPSKNFPSGTGWTARANPLIEFPALPLPPSDVIDLTASGFASGNITLPRAIDISASPSRTDFSYLVPSLGNDDITVTSGYTVQIFVQGDIQLNGNTGISSSPNSLQIYGSDGSSGYDGLNPATNTGTETIGLSGNANIHAFVFAPTATAGVNGGGSSGGFYGAMWIENWAGPPFGSASNHIVIDPPATFDWSLLPDAINNSLLPGQSIKPYTAWQKQQVN